MKDRHNMALVRPMGAKRTEQANKFAEVMQKLTGLTGDAALAAWVQACKDCGLDPNVTYEVVTTKRGILKKEVA